MWDWVDYWGRRRTEKNGKETMNGWMEESWLMVDGVSSRWGRGRRRDREREEGWAG